MKRSTCAVVAAVAILTASAVAKTPPEGKNVLWHDPGDVATLDFTNGLGGAEHAPKPPFTFIKEHHGGSNAKVGVRDATGTEYVVKFGEEVQAETFSSRLMWSAGYFVEPDYFIPSGTIVGAHDLGHAGKYIGSDGSFKNARFKMKLPNTKKLEDDESWRLDQNPFVGSHEFAGLKIMLMLTANWDIKDARDYKNHGANTAILVTTLPDGSVESRYAFTDFGDTMGKAGSLIGRSEWSCKGYTEQTPKFVKGVSGGHVEFGFEGKRKGELTSGITVDDVRWIMQYLSRITDDQIRAGLRASGATPDEVTCFTSAVRDRINQLQAAAK